MSCPHACMTGTSFTVGVVRGDPAGVRQPGRFLDRERVHVGSQHHRWAVTVREHADDARPADARRDLVTGALEPVSRSARGALLLQRQLGMRVQIAVEVLELPSDRALHQDALTRDGL